MGINSNIISISKPIAVVTSCLILMLLQSTETSARFRRSMATPNLLATSFEKREEVVTKGGEVRGLVSDNKGEAILGASVRISWNGGTVAGTTTDFDGKYKVKLPEPGTFDIDITYSGFDTFSLRDIRISSFDTIVVNCKLSPIKSKGLGILYKHRNIPLDWRRGERSSILIGEEIKIKRDTTQIVDSANKK